MIQSGNPSVYMVDSSVSWPPGPHKLSHGRWRSMGAQNLLFLLVSVALGGMAIEAYFIYRLYHPESAMSASSSKVIAAEQVTSPVKRPSPQILPSKPVAHLTGEISADGIDSKINSSGN
ncbi:tumor necrosis factor ligand superfamily member 14 isoform X2 [Antennarius striatus]|uniref:tumor necrosis factor ligand superfamily member 14 isoform X2 n=1 Tax=Antennarius striatus TaxID=241820 RepID=UPI0035B3CBFA